MNAFLELRGAVLAAIAALQADGLLPAELSTERVTVEPPRDPSHGDAASNAALVLAKSARRPPLEIAEALAAQLRPRAEVEAVSIARPGFVNLRLTDEFWRAQIPTALRAGRDYGCSDLGQGRAVNVEYCSANPTGPLHVGHGRGAAYGDALANLLARMGFAVTREYYVNDGGAQVELLARSLFHRYLEALGVAPATPPAGWYPGDYLVAPAQALAAEDGERWQEAAEGTWLPVFRRRAIDAMMVLIRADLQALGVEYDVFSSEAGLIEGGRIEAALAELESRGLLYTGTLPPPKGKPSEDWEPRPQRLFRATDFGDDVDRPLQRSGGEWTYFAADLAYHLDKVRRGAVELIDVWGADHGGYVKRMQAGVRALTDGEVDLDIKLYQLVNLLERGEPVRMSKRAGQMVTLRDVIDRVGRDVVRFIMLTRRNDVTLDFDLAQVSEQSRDNPVWYVQYAHARICSVQRHAVTDDLAVEPALLADVPLELLTDAAELNLIKQLAAWPRVLEGAALHHEPHRIAFYLGELAASFHTLWNQGKERPGLRFLQADQPRTTAARLAMIGAVQVVIASGLELIGVRPVEEMV